MSEIVDYEDGAYTALEREGNLSHEQIQIMTPGRVMAPGPRRPSKAQPRQRDPSSGDDPRNGRRATPGKTRPSSVPAADPQQAGEHVGVALQPENDLLEMERMGELLLNGMKSYSYCYDKFLRAKGLKTGQAVKEPMRQPNQVIEEEQSMLSESLAGDDAGNGPYGNAYGGNLGPAGRGFHDAQSGPGGESQGGDENYASDDENVDEEMEEGRPIHRGDGTPRQNGGPEPFTMKSKMSNSQSLASI